MSTSPDIVRYLRIFRRYIGRRMYLVFVLAILTALAQGFGITLLLPLLRTAQSGGAPDDVGTTEQILIDLLSWLGIADSTLGILGFIALVFIGKGLLQFANAGYQGYLKSRLLRELKTKMFDAYAGMQYRYYIKNNTGHFINVINGQINRFFNAFGSFTGFLTQCITTVSYFAFAFFITWRFALMALVIGGVLLFLFKYLNSYVRRLSRLRAQEMSELNKFLVQTLQSFKYVVSTYQTPHLRSGIVNSVNRLTGYLFRQEAAAALTSSMKEPLSVLVIVGVIALQVTVFQEPIAPIFVALLLFHRGMQSVIGVQSGWQNTMNLIGSLEMVTDEFDNVLQRQESNGSTTVSDISTGITFRDVHFAYDEGECDVLEAINVEIPVNTTVAFVGESGAGKSTLVDMLTLLLRPRTGEIYVDDVPGHDVDLTTWRSQIGYVSQETVVFDDSVANNICLWNGDFDNDHEVRERIQDAARRAHAHHFIQDLPDGYQTVVGDKGVRLSGGQRQRLFVARELFKRPNLLILDEATSALDTQSERYIQSSIDALKGEVTVVIIAHRLSTIKNVDHVYVLENGRVVEDGSYSELRDQEESCFQKMVEMQSL
jgi:subfamily B ATP-binding cassette protein MsbA